MNPQFLNRPRFWVGPLVLGASFSLGYVLTHRIFTYQNNRTRAEPYKFETHPFPGERLETLRLRHGGKLGDLLPDLALIEQERALRKQKSDLVDQQGPKESLAAHASTVEEVVSESASSGLSTPVLDPPLIFSLPSFSPESP